jgi:hypothetical protein
MKERLKKPVRQVVELLVARKYAELESLTNGVRLSATDIAAAIAGYGRQLVSLPNDAFSLMDVVKVKGAEPPKWSIVMPLWTQEEGRSDLSIELTVIERDNRFAIELDDIHVL